MSHSVTIQTRTVTTGSPSALNTSFFRSWTGILKIAQVILGAVCVGLVGYGISHGSYGFGQTEVTFFMLIATTFLIASTILVLSCLCSYTTESIISKTTFELLYHAFGFALLLASSITLLVHIQNYYGNRYNNRFSDDYPKTSLMIASICGVIVMSLLLAEDYKLSQDVFLLLMATSFMMGTAIFIISYIFSPISEPIIGKTNYELIYNGLAFILLLIGALIVVADASKYSNRGMVMTAGVIGIIDSIVYAVNFAWAIRLKFYK